MSYVLLVFIVFCSAFPNIQADGVKDENSIQITTNNKNIFVARGLTSIPKFAIQMITSYVKNIFQKLKNLLLHFEKNAISMLSDTLGFLARSDNTEMTLNRKRRSAWFGNSNEGKKQNSGGVISTVSNLFMAPFKAVFGAVKWVPGAVIDNSAKIGLSVVGELLENPIINSVAKTAISTVEKVGEESWKFAKVNVFPRLDKWVTNVKESHSLPEGITTLLTEIQTLYHLYRFLGLA